MVARRLLTTCSHLQVATRCVGESIPRKFHTFHLFLRCSETRSIWLNFQAFPGVHQERFSEPIRSGALQSGAYVHLVRFIRQVNFWP